MRIVPEQRQVVQIGQRFGRLEVIGVPFYSGKGSSQHVVCQCDCGGMTSVQVAMLMTYKSCGCWRREAARLYTAKRCKGVDHHGMSSTKLYGTWERIHTRCTNKKVPQYRFYGARGITVSPEWKQFEAFKTWALANGYQEGLSIDRIDNDGNYEPSNCQWLTVSENAKKSIVQRREAKVARAAC